jgi:hypothetical protein
LLRSRIQIPDGRDKGQVFVERNQSSNSLDSDGCVMMKVQWRALDEINAGVCDGMTYLEIKETMPEDYQYEKILEINQHTHTIFHCFINSPVLFLMYNSQLRKQFQSQNKLGVFKVPLTFVQKKLPCLALFLCTHYPLPGRVSSR